MVGLIQYWDDDKKEPVTVSTKNPLPLSGGGGGTPADGSITTAMIQDGAVTTAKLAADAKAPFAGTADSASAVAWANVSGKPATFPPTIGTTAATAAAGNHTHAAATTSAAGFLSAADKTKLDGIAANAVNAAGAVTAIAAKTQIAALTPIANPATATVQDAANAYNALLAALKG
ncbi:hypothetical protein [Paenibacillus tyrfis]|uniref:hypothetical protein n=1 Tax=Paenibacillus tyrfis TaxID=1501230 RepID=UPI0005638F63|nr:hypothetical protein [Paenibacillus tyrfis]